MTPRLLASLAVASAAVALAPAAHAATVTYDGTTLVYNDQNGEANRVIASEGITSGYVRLDENGSATVSSADDRCQVTSGSLECQIPAAMRVDLAGGDDSFSLGFGFPQTMPVSISAGDGNDTLQDDYAADVGRSFDGGAGKDTIKGYKGADTLVGGAGDDQLEGGAGPDTVRGGDGNDVLEGDKYQAAAADVIDGGAGFDVMEEYSIPDEDVNPPASVTQDGVADDGRPGENDNVTGIEKITSHVNGVYNGTDSADEIFVWTNITSGDSTINGHGGNDKLTGEQDSETIDGGAGDDAIQGGYGNDVIVGGPGKDKINSDGGSYCGGYSCTVPFGDDTVDVRDGEVDQVECGIGNDTVKADAADQVAPSCETVDVGTPGAAGPGSAGPGTDGPGSTPAGSGQTPAAQAAELGFAVVGKATRKGLTFRVACSAACKVTGTLSKGAKKLGKGRATLIAAGQATVKVKVGKKGRKALKKARAAKLKVNVAGPTGAPKTLTRTVSFR